MSISEAQLRLSGLEIQSKTGRAETVWTCAEEGKWIY